MNTEIVATEVSPEARNSAAIGYCFLSWFMLLSRDQRYSSPYVRSHARYATIIHFLTFILLVVYIRSRNFTTIFLFHPSIANFLIACAFFILLYALGEGIYRAIHGILPRKNLMDFKLSSIQKNIAESAEISSNEKTITLLSHIPFLGIFLNARFGGLCSEGEKFGSWLALLIGFFLLFDYGFTLTIFLTIVAIFWIVSQFIEPRSTVHILSKFWPGMRDMSIYSASVIVYATKLFHSTKWTIPSWHDIVTQEKSSYTEKIANDSSPLVFVPFVNFIALFRYWKNSTEKEVIVLGIITTLILIYSILIWQTLFLVVALLSLIYGSIAILYKKDVRIFGLYPLATYSLIGIQKLIQMIKKVHEMSKASPASAPPKNNNIVGSPINPVGLPTTQVPTNVPSPPVLAQQSTITQSDTPTDTTSPTMLVNSPLNQ